MDEKYNVILMDPPWEYKNKKTGGSMKSASNQKYNVLDTTEIDIIYHLYANTHIADDAVVFCWVTNPMLFDALTLLKSWGYTYKTMITWIKTNCLGMGAWFRGNTEHLLVAVKGNVKAFHCQQKNYIEHPRLGHSEKPKVFKDLIEKAVRQSFTEPRYLEIFTGPAAAGGGHGGNETLDSGIRKKWTVINARRKGLVEPYSCATGY
jgi:N6-adenosine-specific RNA methylase IME4